MEKAIYGLAMPFNQYYKTYNQQTDTYELELTNYEVTMLWDIIQLTLDHDLSKVIGETNHNLIVKSDPVGIYFKMIPELPEGFKAYEDVKNGLLKHCSVTLIRRKTRNHFEENKLISFARTMNINHNFVVKDHTDVLIEEVCLTNNPANPSTFCTADKDHPLLKGVRWND